MPIVTDITGTRTVVPAVPDPHAAASAYWQQLVDYQPALAGALAEFVRGTDIDTRALLARSPRMRDEFDRAPEIAPYRDDNEEDCEACAESGDQCRWHRGYTQALLDHNIIEEFFL